MSIESYNKFEIVGLVQPKKDGYRVIDTNTYKIVVLNFNIKSNNNIFNMEVMGFKPNNNKKIKYQINKGGTNKWLSVPFNERNGVDVSMLSYLHPSFKDEKGNSIRFITDYDFVEYIDSIIDSGNIANVPYKVSGDIKYNSYVSNRDGKIKQREIFVPKKFEKVDESTKQYSHAKLHIYLGSDCFVKIGNEGILNGKSVIACKEKDKGDVKGYEGYDTQIVVPLGENPDEVFKALKDSKFNGDDNRLTEIGMNVELISGSQEVEFTEDMLTPQQKLLIDSKVNTFEEIKIEMGVGKGKFIKEKRRIGELEGYSRSKDSVLKLSDLTLFLEENTVESSEVFQKNENNDSITTNGALSSSGETFSAVNDDDLPF